MGNDIVSCGDVVCVDPHWILNHNCGLKETECLPGWRFFGYFVDPCLRRHIVVEEVGNGVGVVIVLVVKEGCGGCHVIYDDGCIFEGVNSVCVACASLCCSSLDVVWPL